MDDWTGVVAADFAVPDGLDLAAAAGELVGLLASPEPAVRDHQAYAVLATWIERGVLDDRLAAVGDAAAALFGRPEVQARTFAPLVLAAAVERDTATAVLDAATVRRWRDAFAGWWPAEGEIRGWDDTLGWLHAVAHGADLAGALGGSRHLSGPELAGLLRLIAERVVAPTGYQYAHQEEDRIALAVATVVSRSELTVEGATGWLEVVDRLLATGEPGPVPTAAANTFAVLRATYVMVDRSGTADRGAVPHREAVTGAIATRLHEVFPPYPA